MKKIYSYIGGMLLMAAMSFSITACSPDEFASPNEAGIPVASTYEDAIQIDVDQATNWVTFSLKGQSGVMPVWIIDGKNYSSSFILKKYYRKAGDYSVDVKIANANGVSDGIITKNFHIDKTIMNGFGGFVYDSDFNLWKNATVADPDMYYAPGWAQLPNPSYTLKDGAYTITLPSATSDQWQAQFKLNTNIATEASKHYDFSVILTSSTAHPSVTVKLVDSKNDGNAYFTEKVKLEPNEPLCFWKSDLEGIDIANLQFVFDFGGNADNTDIIVENVVFKDHANDDGTVLPEVDTTPEPVWSAVDSPENLWSGTTITNEFFYANSDWSARPNPTMVKNGNTYTISFPDATAAQWQNQVKFHTQVSADTETAYDFRITLNASQDISNVTVKLVQSDEVGSDGKTIAHDGNFFFDEKINLGANSNVVFWKSTVKAPQAMHAISLVLDFGGNPATTDVVIKDIILQKHKN